MDEPCRSQCDDHREALLASTVRIVTRGEDGSETDFGTGIFVTEDWVLTAAHVVPEYGVPYVQYRGREYPARVLERNPPVVTDAYDVPDVALLQVGGGETAIPDHGCVELRAVTPNDGDKLFACGWPLIDARPTLETMPLEFAGWREPADSPRLFVTRGSQVQPGASGAAVIHLDRGVVVGIVKLSRGVDWDAGAVLLPTKAVLAALPDAYGLEEKNKAASASVNSREALEARYGRVLERIEETLATAQDVWRRDMLRALGRAYASSITTEDLALKLLGLPLERLYDPLAVLARAARDPGNAQRLHEDMACCSWVETSPWVAPDGAAQLAEERSTSEPRIVHVPCTDQLTGKMYVRRASSRTEWHLVELTAPDAETDPATGLPARLLHAIRAELLDNLTPIDAGDEQAVRQTWQKRRGDALALAWQLCLMLPPETAALDAELLRGLRRAFPGCTFAIFTPTVARALGEFQDLVTLPTSLPSEAEATAVQLYWDTRHQLEKAATR